MCKAILVGTFLNQKRIKILLLWGHGVLVGTTCSSERGYFEAQDLVWFHN